MNTKVLPVLPAVKALVFVSAWAESDAILAVGNDVTLPTNPTETNGHYEIKMIEPTKTLKKLAKIGQFKVVFSCGFDFMCVASNDKLLAGSTLMVNDLVQQLREEAAYEDNHVRSMRLTKEFKSVERCYRFNQDDRHYLTAMFHNEINSAMKRQGASRASVDKDQDKVTTKELCVIAVRIQRLNPNTDLDWIVESLDIEGQSVAGRSTMVLAGMVFSHRFGMLDQFLAKVDWSKVWACHTTDSLSQFHNLLEQLNDSAMDVLLEMFPHMTRSDLVEMGDNVYGDKS